MTDPKFPEMEAAVKLWPKDMGAAYAKAHVVGRPEFQEVGWNSVHFFVPLDVNAPIQIATDGMEISEAHYDPEKVVFITEQELPQDSTVMCWRAAP